MTIYQNPTDDFDFDLSGVSAESQYDPLPAGSYPLQCVTVEVKKSQYGNRYVKAEFEVTGRDYAGRKIFENFNIEHSNPQTVEIALRGIKQWALACGATGNERLTLAFLKSLEGREFDGTLKIEADRSGQYGPKNRIVKYAAIGAPAAPVAPPPAARAAATAGVRQPWER